MLYVATEDVLVEVRADGTTEYWLDGSEPECVVADGALLVGTFESGLWRAAGDARAERDFERVAGIDPDAVTSLAANPRDPNELWAGTEPSRVYRSTDGGETWVERDGVTDLPSADGWSFPPRPHTHHVRWIEVDPADPAHLYVGIEAGALVQTHDRGETWEDEVSGSRYDTHSMATHPDAPGRAYVAAGDGYAETTDGGETWHYPQAGLDHRYVWSVAVDDDDPDLRFVSAAEGAYTAHRAEPADTYVYRKRGDDPWERLDGRGLPLGSGVTRPVLAAGGAGECYAVSNRGAFVTRDGGDSWESLGVEWPDRFTEQTVRGVALG